MRLTCCLGAFAVFFASGLQAAENKPGVRHVAFTPDGKYLVACASQPDGRGVMSLWDVKTKRLLWSRQVENDIASFAMSPNNETFAIGTFNADVKIIVTKISMMRGTWRSDAKATSAVAFSPDG